MEAVGSLPPIRDPDPFISCDLMDGRETFLTLAYEKHYEFSTLRRAQFSTMAMLYELHSHALDRYMYTCNNCAKYVETRYHCTVCDVSIFTHIYIFLGMLHILKKGVFTLAYLKTHKKVVLKLC